MARFQLRRSGRRQRLILRGRAHVFADSQMREETVEVTLGQFSWMSAVVKQEKAAVPLEVGLFGTAAVVSGAQDFYHTVVQPRRGLTVEWPQCRPANWRRVAQSA